MVPVESEFVDDEWMFWMALVLSCVLTIRTWSTWCMCVWLNFIVSVSTQYAFVFKLKEDDPSLVKMYIFISSAVLITAFSDCVVGSPWTVWVDRMHPLQFFEFRWWCSAENELECIVRTYTNTSKALAFFGWAGIWTSIPRASAWVQSCVSV
jgi:hypothetical protein